MPSPALSHSLIADGRGHFDRGEFSAARRAFAAATDHDPGSAEAQARLAETCGALGDWPAATERWQRVLQLRPGLSVAQTGLAVALRAQGKIPEALAAFQLAVEANPGLPAVHFNLGTCLLGCNRPKEAVAQLRAALALDPKSGDIRYNLALALLKSGAFKTGALAYEARWQSEWRGKERPFTGPRWNGRPTSAGSPLLLWGEQGIGDEIMFAGLVPAAAQAAGTKVLLECAPRLVPLFARTFPSVQVLPRPTPPAASIPAEAVQCALGALPGLLWPATGAPEPPAAYLRADPATVERLRTALATLGPGPKIGLAWRGGHPAAQRPRLIPPPAWAPLLQRPDFVPVCLQHGPDPAELAQLTALAGRPVHQLPGIDPLQDMDSFAALLAALDAVVTVDNSTAHLAGALGVPTAVLLGSDSDWRWGVDGVPCPWYRTVMRLRQNADNDWTDPMQAAVVFLAPHLDRR